LVAFDENKKSTKLAKRQVWCFQILNYSVIDSIIYIEIRSNKNYTLWQKENYVNIKSIKYLKVEVPLIDQQVYSGAFFVLSGEFCINCSCYNKEVLNMGKLERFTK